VVRISRVRVAVMNLVTCRKRERDTADGGQRWPNTLFKEDLCVLSAGRRELEEVSRHKDCIRHMRGFLSIPSVIRGVIVAG
jgi:hypothetical protein